MDNSDFNALLQRLPGRPAWRDSSAALYHADCKTILAAIDASGNSIIISDPPYGINWRSPRGGMAMHPIIGDDRAFDPSHLLRWRCCLFGGQHYYQNLPAGGSWMIWDKRCPACDPAVPRTCKMGPCHCNDLGDFEDIWCSFHTHRTLIRLMWNGFARASERGAKRIHPTQKPVLLMGYLVSMFTRPGDLVIDPYAGSCSTILAARALGRYSIGVELDDSYIAPAVARLFSTPR
jgi:hypothetical protein